MSFPLTGETISILQPDKSVMDVKGWGDEFEATFTTTDGQPLYRHTKSGVFYPAEVPKYNVLAPTSPIGRRLYLTSLLPGTLITKGISPNAQKWVERCQYDTERLIHTTRSKPKKTVEKVTGLCLLIDFSDAEARISREEVDRFCNQKGYNGFENNGSVYDYFFDNSNGLLEYTNIVVDYFRAPYPRDHYGVSDLETISGLIILALDALRDKGFDFDQLTKDTTGNIRGISVICAGVEQQTFALGLWHHKYNLSSYQINDTTVGQDYMVCSANWGLELGTFCHESAHLICQLPDLYENAYPHKGIGNYCLMCGPYVNRKNPPNLCAYMKYRAGWYKTLYTATTALSRYRLQARANDFFIHFKNTKEFIIVECRSRKHRDKTLKTSGMAIWHASLEGTNAGIPGKHYQCRLIQADGMDNIGRHRSLGDATDLYPSARNSRFDKSSNPASVWYDKQSSDLELRNISYKNGKSKFEAIVNNRASRRRLPIINRLYKYAASKRKQRHLPGRHVNVATISR